MMYVCVVHECERVSVCSIGKYVEDMGCFSYSLPHYLLSLRQAFSLNVDLAISVRLASLRALGPAYLYTSSIGYRYSCHVNFLHEHWGSKVVSSCLSGKYFDY